jgi:hypothetical protein
MTVGIICLDGLDHRLASDHDIFDPVAATHQPLVNDLEGEHPLFTPRVWNSLFLGEDQHEITGWLPEPKWKTATEGWHFLWDKVAATSCLNLNLHTNYLHLNACIPEGWTPAHGTFEQMRESTTDLIGFWNETLEYHQPPLQIGYWRLPDAYGHRAAKAGWEDHETVYSWIRERFWDEIDLPDQYIVLSDHGFTMDPSSLGNKAAGRDAHTEHGTVAATWDLPRRSMSGFIPTWHDMIISQVRTGNLEDLGYL